MTEPTDRFRAALAVYRVARGELESAMQWWDQLVPTDGRVGEADKIAVGEAYHIVRAAGHKFDRHSRGCGKPSKRCQWRRTSPSPKSWFGPLLVQRGKTSPQKD